MNWTEIVVSLAFTIGAPIALYYLKQISDAKIEDKNLKRWADGALAAAGRAYEIVMAARERNPTAPTASLVRDAVKVTADDFFEKYRETAAVLNAIPDEAKSRVLGELGKLLAADPNVSVAPVHKPLAPI